MRCRAVRFGEGGWNEITESDVGVTSMYCHDSRDTYIHRSKVHRFVRVHNQHLKQIRYVLGQTACKERLPICQRYKYGCTSIYMYTCT